MESKANVNILAVYLFSTVSNDEVTAEMATHFRERGEKTKAKEKGLLVDYTNFTLSRN